MNSSCVSDFMSISRTFCQLFSLAEDYNSLLGSFDQLLRWCAPEARKSDLELEKERTDLNLRAKNIL